MSKAKFEIGSELVHIPTNTIIILERYATELVPARYLSIGGSTIKYKTNYNFLYGRVKATNQYFEGLTEEFELVK